MQFGQSQDNSQRMFGLGGVVLLHALLIWALVNGLARKVIEVLPAPIETKILQEITPPKTPPPPPPPNFREPPPPYIPPPEINIQQVQERQTAITVVTNKEPPPPAPVQAPVVAAVPKPPVVNARSCREPDYPAMSERLGEAGKVVLALLVGVDGRVVDSKVQVSSGYPRLDEAAKSALSLCKFQPGTLDGKPVQAWGQLAYNFKNPNQ